MIILVGSVYNIIAKVLAAEREKVMGKIIDS